MRLASLLIRERSTLVYWVLAPIAMIAYRLIERVLAMGAVDKIYGTKAQHVELYRWIGEYRPTALKFVVPLDYYANEKTPDDMGRYIALFPEYIDMWLLEHCSLDWVVARIREQYEME